MNRHRYLIIVLGMFAALGVLYSATTPLFESSDEFSHLQVIRYMAQARRLPPQVIPYRRAATGADMAWFLGYHSPPLYYAPPLYHALGALLTFWSPLDDLPERLIPSPSWEAGYSPGGDDSPWNKNIYVHLPDEFPAESATMRATVWLRLLSLALGGVTVVCAYCVARLLWPERPTLALGAAVWVAFNPKFIATSASVTNDPLLNALFSLALLLMLRTMRNGARWPRWAALGALVGTGMLVKQSALALLPLGGLAILGQAEEHAASGERLDSYVGKVFKHGAAFGLAALAVGGWWYAYNALRYGDPLGVAPHLAAQVPLKGFDWRALSMTFRSYWSGFAWGITSPVWIYWAIAAVVVIALLGLLRVCLPGGELWRLSRMKRRALGILAAAVILNTIALVRWAVVTGAPFGRLLFPSIAATGVLCTWGLGQWVGIGTRLLAGIRLVPTGAIANSDVLARARWVGLAVLGGGLVLFAAWVPWGLLRPAFASPYCPEGMPETAQRLDMDFVGGVRLLGYEGSEEDLYPGDTLELVSYWQADETPEGLYAVWCQLGPQDPTQRVADNDRWLGGTLYPSCLWRAGDTVRQSCVLRVPEWAPAPALYWVRLGLVDEEHARLSLRSGGNVVTLGPWRVRAEGAKPGVTPPPPRNPVDARFGEAIRLAGYEVALGDAVAFPPSVPPVGEEVKFSPQRGELEGGRTTETSLAAGTIVITLTWAAESIPTADYTVFVHFLDADGTMIGQHDGPPSEGAYPTSWWLPGDVIADHHALSATVPLSALLSLRVGLYDPVTLARLPAYDASGARLQDDAVILPSP